MVYNTCLPVIFGVPKYAEELLKVVKRKNIKVNYKTILKEVRHEKKEAVFYHRDEVTKVRIYIVSVDVIFWLISC